MLKSVSIKNFKSCDNVELSNLTNITALIGRNSTGKTNILTAVQWAAKSAISADNVDSREFVGIRDQKMEFVFSIELTGRQYRYTLAAASVGRFISSEGLSIILDELLEIIIDSNSEILITRKAGELTVKGWDPVINIEQDVPCLRAIIKLLPKSPVLNHIAAIIDFLEGINYYPFYDFEGRGNKYGAPALEGRLLEHSDYINWLSKYRRSSEPSGSIEMRLLHMYLESREDFDEVISLLGPKALAIISDIIIDKIQGPEKDAVESKDQSGTLYFFEFLPFYSDSGPGVPYRRCGFSDLSFGTRRLIRMVVSLIFDRSTVMLLEQPEDGIHPGLLHKVIPLLRSYSENAQVLLASHSPEVLNRLEPKEIRLVTMKNGFTNVRELNNNELSGVRSYINDEGTLADFLDSIQED